MNVRIVWSWAAIKDETRSNPGLLLLAALKSLYQEGKRMKELKDKVVFYIPSESNGQSINNSAVLHYVAKQLADLFGGCTITDGVGYWKNGQGELISESVKLVYAFGNFQKEIDSLFLLLAEWIGDQLDQESVAYEINNHLLTV